MDEIEDVDGVDVIEDNGVCELEQSCTSLRRIIENCGFCKVKLLLLEEENITYIQQIMIEIYCTCINLC